MEEKEIAKKGSTIVTDDMETKHNKTKIWIFLVLQLMNINVLNVKKDGIHQEKNVQHVNRNNVQHVIQ